MSLDTHSNLKLAIVEWLHRDDITDANCEEFIDLTEAWFNRNLRTRWQQQEATADATEYLELPGDFLEMKDIQWQGSPRRELAYLSPEYCDLYDSTGTAGTPSYYTIVGNQIRLVPAPSSATTVRMHYFKSVPALSGSNTTNWVLTDFPDAYLFGCLIHGAAFIQDDALLVRSRDGFAQVVQEIQREGRRSQYGGALQIKVA